MTVKDLINKLSKMPSGNKVIFVNTDVFVPGAYEVTEVKDFEDGTIVLDSDYEKNYWEETEVKDSENGTAVLDSDYEKNYWEDE